MEKKSVELTNTIPPAYVRFVVGGLSGMGAACFTHPLDMIKTRMQLSGIGLGKKEHKTSLHAVKHILKTEGPLAIYDGLSASLLRQATFTTARMGFFSWLVDVFTAADGTPPGALVKTFCGICGGVMAAFVGTPAEVTLIRMAADGRLPVAEQRRYKNVLDAKYRIVKEEGVLTLWRGCVPTMTRGVVLNMAQMITYLQTKEFLIKTEYFEDNFKCHFTSSFVSGIVSAFASLPVDIVKTRLQNMKIINGIPEYTGMFDVWKSVIKKEGVLALWKGLTPSYMRSGPHTIIFFLFIENLTRLYKMHVDS